MGTICYTQENSTRIVLWRRDLGAKNNGAALLDGFVGDADGGTVVAADVGRRLWMAYFGEGDSHWHGVLAVVEHAAGFGFGCGGDDGFGDGAVLSRQ